MPLPCITYRLCIVGIGERLYYWHYSLHIELYVLLYNYKIIVNALRVTDDTDNIIDDKFYRYFIKHFTDITLQVLECKYCMKGIPEQVF